MKVHENRGNTNSLYFVTFSDFRGYFNSLHRPKELDLRKFFVLLFLPLSFRLASCIEFSNSHSFKSSNQRNSLIL